MYAKLWLTPRDRSTWSPPEGPIPAEVSILPSATYTKKSWPRCLSHATSQHQEFAHDPMTVWLRGQPHSAPRYADWFENPCPLVFGDSQSALAVANCALPTKNSKHLAARYHLVKEHLSSLCYVPPDENRADPLTKSLPIRKGLGVFSPFRVDDVVGPEFPSVNSSSDDNNTGNASVHILSSENLDKEVMTAGEVAACIERSVDKRRTISEATMSLLRALMRASFPPLSFGGGEC